MCRKSGRTLLLALLPLVLAVSACTVEAPIVEVQEEKCIEPLALASTITRSQTGTFVAGTVPAENEQELVRRLDNCICGQIGAPAEPYDNLDHDTVVDRTKLRLNGEVLDVAATSKTPEVYEISGKPGWPEGATATVPGAIAICWMADTLLRGEYDAEISFTMTSGKVERYSWRFELVGY